MSEGRQALARFLDRHRRLLVVGSSWADQEVTLKVVDDCARLLPQLVG